MTKSRRRKGCASQSSDKGIEAAQNEVTAQKVTIVGRKALESGTKWFMAFGVALLELYSKKASGQSFRYQNPTT